jgi:hypothetical protein
VKTCDGRSGFCGVRVSPSDGFKSPRKPAVFSTLNLSSKPKKMYIESSTFQSQSICILLKNPAGTWLPNAGAQQTRMRPFNVAFCGERVVVRVISLCPFSDTGGIRSLPHLCFRPTQSDILRGF